ncbi:MAG: Threonylcarbamoyladenosine tRNA methylthiotransferase MtaB [Chlamydiales bacterium]|nr:Threonylcarbamoyladenosine tRNA methylthiotransferase MtaB [Chlamydiales bacterium]
MIRQNPNAEIVVTGCSSERRPDLIQKIGGVSKIVPNADKERLIEELFPDEQTPEFSIKNFEAHTRAFVKVQDGCNSFCTYCIIPYVRGRSVSRKLSAVIKEVEQLVASGYKDIVITGINVGDYEDGDLGLADLIRSVDQVKGVKRVRLSSIDPDEVDEKLLDAIVNGKNTCHSLHLVLQSGSNVILKRMNRKYTRQIFYETVEKLKKASSDFTFTTDVIVGFPGETESDFEETLEVMREVKFAKVHMFPYSPRERTRAALYPNQVAQEVMLERKNKVLRLAEQTAFDLREQYVGRTLSVLTEACDAQVLSGHTENFLAVKLEKQHFSTNQLVEVKLVENTADGLVGVHA